MGAGGSAQYEAGHSRPEADEYARLRQEAMERARRYELASRTEAEVGGRLAALTTLGWRVLADRRWVGSKRAHVDYLLVGPGGVVVVDVKAWGGALELRKDSVFGGGECRDDELSRLLSLTDRVQDSVSPLGLTRQALRAVVVLADRRLSERTLRVDLVGEQNVAAWVTRFGQRLDPGQVDEIASVLERDFPRYDRRRPTEPVRDPGIRMVIPFRKEPDALLDVDELSESILRTTVEGPVEEWMTYLHPDQLRLVSTSWSGPARVRGPAGTGKTVVGLHRASYLAERTPEKVLFVTLVNTLPVVLAELCERMSPSARANICFTGLHRLALDIVEQAGLDFRMDDAEVETAFAGAWVAVGRSSALTALDERWRYWKEELDHVVKGRGLTDFDEYAHLPRLGRRTPMRAEHRLAMWELYVEYERRLHRNGAHDFTDVLIAARDLVRRGAVRLDFGAVVVDEVQDLNLVGLELLHAIAGDGPNGLMIIGDGQQAVYPGGFTLSEAGISVTGRAAVLRANYRNTAEILEVAESLVAQDTYDDLDGNSEHGRREVDVRRRGGQTTTVRADDQRSLEAALLAQIDDATGRRCLSLGDMALLVYSRSEVVHYESVLRRAGLPFVSLLDYDGGSSDRIVIGTFKRAKGLEFEYVLLPGLREGLPEPWLGESDDAYRERAERMRRELFVGMTRARDGLWLGYLEPGPSLAHG